MSSAGDRIAAALIGMAVFLTITTLVERLRAAERALLVHDLGAGAARGASVIFAAVREQQSQADDA